MIRIGPLVKVSMFAFYLRLFWLRVAPLGSVLLFRFWPLLFGYCSNFWELESEFDAVPSENFKFEFSILEVKKIFAIFFEEEKKDKIIINEFKD